LTFWKSETDPKKISWSKKRSRNDLRFFSGLFFPKLARLRFSAMHAHLFARRRVKSAETPPARRGAIDVVLAPRGSAKSTLVSLIFPIHAALHRRDPYIVLISATHRQAVGRLENIRRELTSNENLLVFYPDELQEISRCNETTLIVNGARIDAFSAGSELRGLTFGPWRPTWIILDDVESSRSAPVSDRRDAVHEWMAQVIENLGNGYTNIDLIGTLLHPDALPARLAGRPDVQFVRFRSIEREADRNDLWDEWRARQFDLNDPDRLANAQRFFDERRDEMLRGARVLWPEKESYYDLQALRARIGDEAFDKEKQNEPRAEGASIFHPARFRRFKLVGGILTLEPASDGAANPPRPTIALADLRVVGFLDPAMGGADGDFAAVATVGVDAVGYLYVLDVWLERAPPSEQIPRLFELHERWSYRDFGVEANAFQRLLLEPIEAERARRRAAGRPWMLPVRAVLRRDNKKTRILKLEPLIRSGWVLFADDLSREFINQIADFPKGRHDDGPDALHAAVELAREAQTPRKLERTRDRSPRGSSRSF
jgi:predicted phage terminase large subunit-like protein